MTDLTTLTLSEAREGLTKKSFTATELTEAFLQAIEAGNGALKAFVLPTPENAIAQAKASDARLAKGDARPLEGIPLGHKDLFCTEGIRTTACRLAHDAVAVGEPLFSRQDPGSPFVIEFVPVEVRGTPEALEHEEIRWVAAGEAAGLELAPSDLVFWRKMVMVENR